MSLLPAATEIVAALGAQDLLVGISHECDYPASVLGLPRVTSSSLDPSASGALIDREVRRLRDAGVPVIAVDADQLRGLAPDVVITQDLCQVCAVSDGQIHRLASTLGPAAKVVSLSARNLDGIRRDISQVGAALNFADEAEELGLALEFRLRRLADSRPARSPRVLCLEWLDPVYLAGHWVPELVAAAGGRDVGAVPGSHSAPSDWSQLEALDPDCIFILLCGFGIERSREELQQLTDPAALELMARTPTWIIDGNAYTSRAGPRVVDGAARMQSAFLGRPMTGLKRWTNTRSALTR